MVVREPGPLPAVLWRPPPWLKPHQPWAAARLVEALARHGIALLADETGLGKTYVALAVATRYRRVHAVVPSVLAPQWRRAATLVGAAVAVTTHESLSRGGRLPTAELLLVDEAHHFRNPCTRRYDRLARGVRGAHVLLISATPVVNRVGDLTALLRLVCPPGAIDIRPLIVARSAEQAGLEGLPAVDDVRVRAPQWHLTPVLAAIHALRFPSFGPGGADLLRRHLLYRLGSSLAAAAETIRRHARYLEHVEREPLSRRAFRRLVDPDDPQLTLSFDPPQCASTRAIAEERRRLERLRALLAATTDPKPAQLIPQIRPGTIVFTAATATAQVLAHWLRWKRVVVVTGKGARIASGALPVARALDLFAPRARGAVVAEGERADVLVATDLASEGLDLQDADQVIHYDLPWTPQRLAQRLGRVARLGSRHRRVRVVWFPPPPDLRLPQLLRAKEASARRIRTEGTVDAGDGGAASAVLLRALYRIARAAHRRRDVAMIAAIDQAMSRVRQGLAIGAERELADLVAVEPRRERLQRWLGIHPPIAGTTAGANGNDGSV